MYMRLKTTGWRKKRTIGHCACQKGARYFTTLYSEATQLTCGGILDDDFRFSFTNLLPNLKMKEFIFKNGQNTVKLRARLWWRLFDPRQPIALFLPQSIIN